MIGLPTDEKIVDAGDDEKKDFCQIN